MTVPVGNSPSSIVPVVDSSPTPIKVPGETSGRSDGEAGVRSTDSAAVPKDQAAISTAAHRKAQMAEKLRALRNLFRWSGAAENGVAQAGPATTGPAAKDASRAVLTIAGSGGDQVKSGDKRSPDVLGAKQAKADATGSTQNGTAAGAAGLDEKEAHELEELKRDDQDVRAHEQAHLAAAGPLARGGPKYSYKAGPDGQRYVVAGEVDIVLRTGRTPQETIRLMQQAEAAALAPADPSPQDIHVAQVAVAKELEAQHEIQQQTRARLEKSAAQVGPHAKTKPAQANKSESSQANQAEVAKDASETKSEAPSSSSGKSETQSI